TVEARQRWERLDRDRGEEQPQVADEVDGIGGGRARPRDQHAGERGSDDPGRLPQDLVERHGCGHQLGADQSRRRRLPRRAADRDATKTPRHGRTLTGRSRGPYPKAVSTAPSSTSRPSASSGSSIVSGGSSRMTLPYVPALSTITPPSSAARVIRFIVSVTSGS